jgi:hypothetical protein
LYLKQAGRSKSNMTDTPSSPVPQNIIEAVQLARAVKARLEAEAKAAEARANAERAARCQQATTGILAWLESYYGYSFAGIPNANYQVSEAENENGRFHWLVIHFGNNGGSMRYVSLNLAFQDGKPADDPVEVPELWTGHISHYKASFENPVGAFDYLDLWRQP